jgi:hypothetical protein
LVVQLALPLRQQLSEQPSAWTLSGFNFAWNVMAAEKAGAVTFLVHEQESGRSFTVEPRRYLSAAQERAMAQDPDMIAQLARYIAGDLEQRTGRRVSVHADAWASLNGRAATRFIDPTLDLARSASNAIVIPLSRRRHW